MRAYVRVSVCVCVCVCVCVQCRHRLEDKRDYGGYCFPCISAMVFIFTTDWFLFCFVSAVFISVEQTFGDVLQRSRKGVISIIV